MPLNIDILQILLHMLNFVILAGGLTFILYRPVTKFLDDRRNGIAKQLSDANDKLREAEAMKAEYEQKLEEARVTIAKMQAEAEHETAEVSKEYLREAREKASAIILAAEKEAEERKEHILESAQTEIGELVITAAQKLLGETVTPERNSELYDEFIRLADKKQVKKQVKK